MDLSSLSPSTSRSELRCDCYSPTSLTGFSKILSLMTFIEENFFEPSLSKLKKLDLITNFIKTFYMFQKIYIEKENFYPDFLNSQKKIDPTISSLATQIYQFIQTYETNLESTGTPSVFDQTILLMMNGLPINPYFRTSSSPITIGSMLLKKYPNAHPVAVAYLLNHLSLYESPSNSSYFVSDCQFGILLLTSTLNDLGSFSSEEYCCLIEAAFPLRKETFISYHETVVSNDSSFTDERSPRLITPLIKDHPLFPFNESSLLEKRKEIAANTSSWRGDLVN